MSVAFHTATVRRVRPLSPGLLRLTLGGAGLAAWASSGVPDEWLKLQVPSVDGPPRPRNYSVRAVRTVDGAPEIDIDVVIHDGGLGAEWARAASPGDTIGISAPGGSWAPPPDTAWHLLATDLAGLPAAGRIVESLPTGARAHVVAETFDPADRQAPWETAGDVRTTWIHGSGCGHGPSRLEQAVRTFPRPDGPGYLWVAGETRTVRRIRRWVRHDQGLPRERYSLIGYWLPDAETWDEGYEAAGIDAIWHRGAAEGRDHEQILDEVDDALDAAGL